MCCCLAWRIRWPGAWKRCRCDRCCVPSCRARPPSRKAHLRAWRSLRRASHSGISARKPISRLISFWRTGWVRSPALKTKPAPRWMAKTSKGMRHFLKTERDVFQHCIVRYCGREVVPFAENLWAVPLSIWWAGLRGVVSRPAVKMFSHFGLVFGRPVKLPDLCAVDFFGIHRVGFTAVHDGALTG
jgi:hypothetical protein